MRGLGTCYLGERNKCQSVRTPSRHFVMCRLEATPIGVRKTPKAFTPVKRAVGSLNRVPGGQ